MNERSKWIRREAIKLARKHDFTHYGGSFSCAEILIALYDHVLKSDDIFILSKGHGCLCYYIMLRDKGYNPLIEGHPTRDIKNGIYATTGSLGHGLPFGIGIALGKRMKGDKRRVFILMGDGECQEGTFWESLLLINRLKLDNLTIIIDYNRFQGSGKLKDILYLAGMLPGNFMEVDGHDIDNIVDSIDDYHYNFIIANTIKGSGVSFMECNNSWHSRWMTDEEFKQAMVELT